MIRRPHQLRAGKSTELPSAAVWVDTETSERRYSKDTVAHFLRFGYAVFARTKTKGAWLEPDWLRFSTQAKFWEWVFAHLRPRMRLYLFAHNWAFDAPVLGMFGVLPAAGWKLTKAVIESPPVILHWRKDTNTIVCLDTLNWWRMPLEKVGQSIGLPKLEMPAKRASRAAWNTYARRDVEIIYSAINSWWRFIADFDLGSFAPTLASQALTAFTHRFMDDAILIDANPKALSLARDSLHGGRVECFRIGKIAGPISVLDINSMYPYVMREHSYPISLVSHSVRAGLSDLTRWLKTHAVIARVRLETRRRRFAHVVDQRLIFPIGRFVATLTTPDLLDAIKNREIHSVIEVAIYNQAPIFRRFIDEIYALRQAALAANQSVQSWLLKILMNSLYGKFAQRGTVWESIKTIDDTSIKQWIEFDYETGSSKTYRQFAGTLQVLQREPESYNSFPAIAAHVTAYARAYLYNLAFDTFKGRVIYADTDSLFVRSADIPSGVDLTPDFRLGAFKVDGVYDWCELKGAKDYALPNKEVIKGIRKSARWIGPNTVQQEQWFSLVGLLAARDLTAPRTKLIEKHLSRIYQKGSVRNDGMVLPFRLREW